MRNDPLPVPHSEQALCDLDPSECMQIHDELSPRDQVMLVLGVRTGFRVTELLSLRVKDVWQHGAVVTEIHVARNATKNKSAGAVIPLHAHARKVITDYITELILVGGGNADDFLFMSRKGNNKPIQAKSAWKILKSAADKSGLSGKIGTHSMRKTFAKKVYRDSGNDLTVTRKALRHSHISTTMAYLEPDKAKIDDAITK